MITFRILEELIIRIEAMAEYRGDTTRLLNEAIAEGLKKIERQKQAAERPVKESKPAGRAKRIGGDR